jgi:hypothetical protein
MLKTLLPLYIQALLLTILGVAIISIIYAVVFIGFSKVKDPMLRQDRIHDLITADLLITPLLSFGVLALLIIFKVY